MPGEDKDNLAEEIASVRRRSHRRRRRDPLPEDPALPVTKEKRRLAWEVKDTFLILIALGLACFLPLAIKKLFTLIVLHAMKVEQAPFGLNLLSTLGGLIIAIVIFVILCYATRKHHYAVAITIMGAMLAFILVSYPAADWLARWNEEQIKAKNESLPAPARPRR
jgi:hypothetical protein